MIGLVCIALICSLTALAAERPRLEARDVFDLQYASDPRISPDGTHVVYTRNLMDIMKDRAHSNLWILKVDGSGHRPLTSGAQSDFSARWSPSGDRLAYVSTQDGSAQIYVRWMDTGQTARVAQLTSRPGSLTWSPEQFLLQVLVSRLSLGPCRALHEALAAVAGRQRKDADHGHHRRGGLPHAHVGVRAVLPGPEAA